MLWFLTFRSVGGGVRADLSFAPSPSETGPRRRIGEIVASPPRSPRRNAAGRRAGELVVPPRPRPTPKRKEARIGGLAFHLGGAVHHFFA